MRIFPFLLVPIALASAGCLGGGNPYFTDDEGGEKPSVGLFTDAPDSLSLPYALGTRVTVSASAPAAVKSAAGWSLRSSAPQVFAIGKVTVNGGTLSAECTATGEGEAELVLFDPSGEEVHSTSVTVQAADRARLFRHGTLRTFAPDERSGERASAPEARVLTGGTGAYAVAYYRGEQRVYGRGLVGVEAPAGFSIRTQTTTNQRVNEWLFVTPRAPGSGRLALTAGGRPVGSLPLEAVSDADLGALVLDTPAAGPSVGWVHARASDTAGRTVDGVYCDWTVAGAPQTREGGGSGATKPGDLLRVNLVSSPPRAVEARHGRLAAAAAISLDNARVEDTTYLGCSAGPAPRTSGVAAGALLAVLGGALARRRRRAAPPDAAP